MVEFDLVGVKIILSVLGYKETSIRVVDTSLGCFLFLGGGRY